MACTEHNCRECSCQLFSNENESCPECGSSNVQNISDER
jgi:RNA polymerase subunit RPABC4/transcription elongation factor Spt4